MLSLRAHAIICAAFFAALILMAVVGNVLAETGVIANPTGPRVPAIVVFFGLFIGFGFSAVPVMVKVVLGFQKKIGNQDVAPVKTALANQNLIIWIMWGIMAAGLAIAVPAAIADGAFGDEIAATWGSDPGKSQGVLVAAPGMTLAELARGSTLPLDLQGRQPPITTVAADIVFDFQIPGSAVRFERCRYYFMSTGTRDREHIEGISIGTSTRKVPRPALDTADADLHRRLAADGWLTGHEVYRTDEDRQLHGGKTRGAAGHIWAKGDVVLNIRGRRMDDPGPGEDPATTGAWIQFIELWGRTGYSGIERFVFEPWQDPGRLTEDARSSTW